MIDVAAARTALAGAVRVGLDASGETSTPVHETTPDGTSRLPAVILGMPSWRPGLNFCLDEQEFPVAVVVEAQGASVEGPVRRLDNLWPIVVGALKDAIQNGTLDLVAAEQHLNRAEFGSFLIAGSPFPAYLITLTLHG